MYQIIENPKVMSKEEIEQKYSGYWVYIVQANINPHGTLIEGMPVVLGEYQFDGVEEGIYERFDLPKYGRRLSYTLVPHGNMISSVFGVGWNE